MLFQLVAVTLSLLLGVLTPTAALQSWSLAESATWTLDNRLGSANVSGIIVNVPSCALSSLLDAGTLVQDPLYRYNELLYRWVAQDTWTWTATFPTPSGHDGDAWHLRIDTVDGVGEVLLNGRSIAFPRNSHRPVLVDVSDELLAAGASANNTLVIAIGAAAAAAAAAEAIYPYPVPAVQQQGGLPNYNFIRKAASDFGWDWGPAFAPACILGDVSLTAYAAAFLTDAAISQQESPNGSITVGVTAYFRSPASDAPQSGVLTLDVGNASSPALWSEVTGVSLVCEDETARVPLAQGESCAALSSRPTCSAVLSLRVDPPFERWWPWELGLPTMHTLRLSYVPDGVGTGAESSLTRPLGLRDVTLVTEPTEDGAGETFFFRVNGVPMFMRGANVVPADVLESRVTPALLARQVADARAVGMNMLRVWGGGRYAGDAFYDAADAAGMLIWQEVMMACAAYPRDADFLKEVTQEVAHQFSRLSSHPSIAIWGGNNENEASLGWSVITLLNPKLYAVDFATLFLDVVRPILLGLDPGLAFVDTSPSNGLLSTSPYVKRWGDVSSPAFGDVHFYDYDSDAFDPATYPPAKFVSEFGFMSFPSFSVYREVTDLGDWDIDSGMTQFRLRHANGVQELQSQMNRHFVSAVDAAPAVTAFDGPSVASMDSPAVTVGGPTTITTAGNASAEEGAIPTRFKAFVHLSQVQQAVAYETAAGAWRRGKDSAAAQTMGMLYWQLNDVWQGPSWSGINYGGQWKLLHHAARRFFSPILVSTSRDGDTLRVSLTNDLPLVVEGSLTIEAVLYAALDAGDVVTLLPPTPYTLPPLSGHPEAWNATLESLTNTVTLGAPTQLTYDSDYLIRLRFCPSAVGAGGEELPNPLGAAAQAPSTLGVEAASTVGLHAPASEEEGCGGGVRGLDGASPEQCTLAAELLRCSETLFHPTEFGLARLWGAPPTLTAQPAQVPAGEAGTLALQINSSGVALWVAVEPPPGVSGNFNASGFLLLPWEPQTVLFTPDVVQGQDGSMLTAADLASRVSLRCLQQSMQEYQLSTDTLPTSGSPSAAGSSSRHRYLLMTLVTLLVSLCLN